MAKNIYQKLVDIQLAIRVPKDQNNSFAGFKYRSAEDILEKLKPLLVLNKVLVTLTDSIECHADQVYVKATAQIFDTETEPNMSLQSDGFAREEKIRPKMSEGQLTGAASSYARKYALNGLLLLDDNKDPDSLDSPAIETPSLKAVAIDVDASQAQKSTIKGLLESRGVASSDMRDWLASNYDLTGDMSRPDAQIIIDDLTNKRI